MRAVIITLFLTTCICCSKIESNNSNNPANSNQSIDSLENLTLNGSLVDTVILHKELTIESNEQVFLDGTISETLISDRDQIIIAVQRLGKLGIYVFNDSGELMAKMGRYGRGPGEFEAISSMTITDDILWVLDTRLQKISFYSLKYYKHLNDVFIDKSLVVGEDKFVHLMKGLDLFTIADDKVLLKFEVKSWLSEPNMYTSSVYYKISNDGKISPNPILQLDRYDMYIFKDRVASRTLGFTAPFTRSSLFTTNQKGDMYSAWSEEFRITKLNNKGEFGKVIHYDMNKSTLDLDKVDIYQKRKKLIEDQGIPDTWPVLHNIVADDKGRIWVSTITDSDSTFKWFIINDDGDLIGSFTLQGKRSEINPFVGQPFYLIKNEYFYTREFDYYQGIDRIIKYRIEITERE